jgi:putative hydrolase of the HAD superfamily
MSLPAAPATPDRLDHVEVWLFDLDNTLYPAECNLFAQIDRRMGEYVAGRLGVGLNEAKRLQKQYFHEHGTTLRGLMTAHGVEPQEFLDYVHDIDLGVLRPWAALDAALAALAGRKLIYTNGSTAHAERVLDRLGIARHFEAIHDIAAAGWRPKPDPAAYAALVGRFGFAPRRAAMVEDIAGNLAPAAELGMTTVWVPNARERERVGEAQPPFVDHVAEDLAAWLADRGPRRGPFPPD